MKENFEVWGCFYRLNGLHCRKYLDIKKWNSSLEKPDLLVVMMNPGNSKPIDGKYLNNRMVGAISDRTQHQIMRLMENCGYGYSRIINLTDIQETKSKRLFSILTDIEKKNMAHSIFDPRRREELDALVPENATTVFAWGVAEELTELAQAAMDRFEGSIVYGLRKDDRRTAYYHPLPPSYPKQVKWVNEISQQLKKSIQ